MNQITDIETTYIDEEQNVQYIDVYYEDQDEGQVAAMICLDTGKVFYRNIEFKFYERIKAIADEISRSVTPKTHTETDLKKAFTEGMLKGSGYMDLDENDGNIINQAWLNYHKSK